VLALVCRGRFAYVGLIAREAPFVIASNVALVGSGWLLLRSIARTAAATSPRARIMA